jgi:hypothetical protein
MLSMFFSSHRRKLYRHRTAGQALQAVAVCVAANAILCSSGTHDGF